VTVFAARSCSDGQAVGEKLTCKLIESIAPVDASVEPGDSSF